MKYLRYFESAEVQFLPVIPPESSQEDLDHIKDLFQDIADEYSLKCVIKNKEIEIVDTYCIYHSRRIEQTNQCRLFGDFIYIDIILSPDRSWGEPNRRIRLWDDLFEFEFKLKSFGYDNVTLEDKGFGIYRVKININ